MKVRTAAVRELAQQQKVPVKWVKQKLKTIKSNKKTLDYKVIVDQRGISWSRLKTKNVGITKSNKRGKGIKAGKHRHRHAFIAKGKGGGVQVFVRDDSDRLPVRALKIRIAKTFKIAWAHSIKNSATHFQTTLKKEIEFRSQKYIKR